MAEENGAPELTRSTEKLTAVDDLGTDNQATEAESEQDGLSIDVLPDSQDASVQSEAGRLRDEFKLHQLILTFSVIGKYLHLTNLAMAREVALLLKVQTDLFSTLKLCDAASLMLQTLQSSANNMLEKLKIAYLYLRDGFEDFARTDVEATKKDVDSMGNQVEKTIRVSQANKDAVVISAEEVKRELDQLQEEPNKEKEQGRKKSLSVSYSQNNKDEVTVIGSSEHVDGSTGCFACFRRSSRKSGHVDGSKAGYLCCRCPRSEQAVGTTGQDAEARPEQGDKGGHAESSKGCCPCLSGSPCSKPTEGEATKDAEGKPEERKNQKEEPKPDPELLRRQAKLKLTAVSLDEVKSSYDICASLLDNLMPIVEGWRKECVDVLEPALDEGIRKAKGLTEEQKKSYWNSVMFKTEVMGYYTRWRALQVYAEDMRKKLREIRQDLEDKYTDNPLPGDAEVLAWKLAEQDNLPEIQKIVRERKKLDIEAVTNQNEIQV